MSAVVRVESGTLEGLKWLALVGMVVDHVNTAFFVGQLGGWATVVGRMVFPVFAMVFAYNLARPGTDLWRVLKRLVLVAAIATPPYVLLFAGKVDPLPLNVLWTFAVAVGVMLLFRRRCYLDALMVFLLGGLFVEYAWAGVIFVVYAAAYAFKPDRWLGLTAVAALVAVCAINGNAYALLALPVVWMASKVQLPVPRLRWAFYAAYPGHLIALVLLSVR